MAQRRTILEENWRKTRREQKSEEMTTEKTRATGRALSKILGSRQVAIAGDRQLSI